MSAWLNDQVDRLRPSIQRTPELDGLRGVAILLVLCAHLLAGVSPHDQPFLPGVPDFLPGGGLTGVQLFFVLSGYLITGILVQGIMSSGIRSLRTFYTRRALRLLPALLVICGAYALIVLIRYSGTQRRLGEGSILAALSYTSNLPVFANDGALGHTWSLAVEEQFYLVWPLLLLLCLRLRGSAAAAAVACAVVVATAVLRHVLSLSPGVSWDDFRWDALMVGALAALLPLRAPRWAGWLGWGVVAYFSMSTVTYQPDVYLLTALGACAVLVTVREQRWLRNPLLQALGLISYGLYLWHVLILRAGLPGPASLALSLLAALASYQLIELRCLRLGIASNRADARAPAGLQRPHPQDESRPRGTPAAKQRARA